MQHLSLSAAILININIMLGAGLFINTTELAHRAGALGWLAYGIVGLLMIPLILSIAQLVRMYPQGAFYTYAMKEFNPSVGFISAWIYFIGKLASATLTIHAAATLIHALFPVLHVIQPIHISAFIIGIFGLCNMHNIRTGSIIQKLFLGAKIIPITLVVCAGFIWFSPTNITAAHMLWEGLPSCIPLVLFAVLGFEAACSLSSKIENPEKNAPKAIVISFAVVIGIYCLYQFLAYAMLGDVANSLSGYKDFFAYLAHLISPAAYDKTMALLYCTIALSTLGGAYGILYSNMWNLHTLAQHKHIAYASLFTSLNTHAMPTWCVIAEVSICLLYLFVSGGTALPLQQIAATSCAITYGISICALIAAKKNRSINFSWFLTLCGFINCLMLATLCVVYVLRGSHPALYVFVGLLVSGIGMFLATKNLKE